MPGVSIEAIVKTSTRSLPKRSFSMSKTSGIVKFLRRNAVAYMFLTPWLLGLLVLTLYPMAYSLWLGFTNYDFTKPDSTQLIGLGNYLKMFGPLFGLSEFTVSTGDVMSVDPYYLQSLSVTFVSSYRSRPLLW
jgi:multiple sugar transport system permease protein